MSAAEEVRIGLLGPPRRTLAVAESVTGGRLQALITGVSGASACFLGGVCAYTVPQKGRLLGVDVAHATAVDGVSARVAGEMAVGACRLFGADLAVATTGYAEPAPARGVAPPFAWLALAATGATGPRVLMERRVEFPGLNRQEAQQAVAEAALALLREFLRAPATAPAP
ncbi:MAG: Nicotinamide-nucleotide amidohydrolase PncC [Verrucomicrobiota bacterium]|jgi:nicotinamide-nucleotide amidase